MERSKRETKVVNNTGERIEFTAPFPLATCAQRIQDANNPVGNLQHPGLDARIDKAEPGYHFRLSRRYDRYKRRPQGYFFIEGDLREKDAHSTYVTAQLRTGWSSLILSIGLSVLITIFIALFAPEPIRLVVMFVPVILWIYLVFKMAADGRALIPVLYHLMGVDSPDKHAF